MTDAPSEPLRLHIGGWQVKPGWKILNIENRPGVDYLGDATDLSRFADGSIAEVYASHVYEHVGYGNDKLPHAFKEVHRVLTPGGRFMFSVPDLQTLCRLFLEPNLNPAERFQVMRMMFGGQMDEHDYHRIGLTEEFMQIYLRQAGFRAARRVENFGLFDDTSSLQFFGVPISLNMEATK